MTIEREFVTTLPELPGYKIVAAHGIVADVGTGSAGKFAHAKGIQAFKEALEGVLTSAETKGANAIVGLQISNYGAGIGGAAMGDAVGATLLGTAVTVEALGRDT